MKKNEDLEKDIQEAIKRESLLNAKEPGADMRIVRNLRKIVLITSLAGIGLLFTGCYAGYVASEPSYMAVNRPPQPSSVHIWIDGNWTYNPLTHSYVQHNGYWQQPSQGRNYVSGHFQSSPKGYYWVHGRYEKKNHQKNRGNR